MSYILLALIRAPQHIDICIFIYIGSNLTIDTIVPFVHHKNNFGKSHSAIVTFPKIKAIVLPRNISSTYTYLLVLWHVPKLLCLCLSLLKGLSCPTFTVTKKVFKNSDGHWIRFPDYSIVSFLFPPAPDWDLQVASGLKVRRPEGPTAHLQVNIQFRRRSQTIFCHFGIFDTFLDTSKKCS